LVGQFIAKGWYRIRNRIGARSDSTGLENMEVPVKNRIQITGAFDRFG
jgi:hypothetical protein